MYSSFKMEKVVRHRKVGCYKDEIIKADQSEIRKDHGYIFNFNILGPSLESRLDQSTKTVKSSSQDSRGDDQARTIDT